MDLEPWEALDVDDSDLSTFLRPCNNNNNNNSNKSSSSCLIPGPAGAVQAVMRNRDGEDPLPTQEFLKTVDLDFNTNPWLCALQFVRSGMVDGDGDDEMAHETPLKSINYKTDRVALVVGLVKSCTPNGFGDITVTLKDPTATVSATVHRKVLSHSECGKKDAITVGSVLILQKVAVFSPFRSTCYLNITSDNILKVFSNECGPPSQQLTCPARPVRHTLPSIEIRKQLLTPGSTFSLPQERTEGIMSSLRLDSSFRQLADSDKQRGEPLASISCHNDNGHVQDRETVLEREKLPLSQDNAGSVEVNCRGELENDMKDQTNTPNLEGGGQGLAWISQGNSSTINSVQTSRGEKTGMENHLEGQTQMVNTNSSIPHWTEEQLDELLAFD